VCDHASDRFAWITPVLTNTADTRKALRKHRQLCLLLLLLLLTSHVAKHGCKASCAEDTAYMLPG
jgi:hypothetical protein